MSKGNREIKLIRALIDSTLDRVHNIVLLAETFKVTDEQWYLDFEDELNAVSTKDHSVEEE